MLEYKSNFSPSEVGKRVLEEGNIVAPGETPSEMVERLVLAIGKKEAEHSGYAGAAELVDNLGVCIDLGLIVPSTPIMTNAGREFSKPLSACTMPTLDLASSDMCLIKKEIDTLHQQGMGTGFNLNSLDDPVVMLKLLNRFAVEGSMSGNEHRPVGNMAILSIYHPHIMQFIKSKVDAAEAGQEWKFNISIDINEDFFRKLACDDYIVLGNGTKVKAARLFEIICDAAVTCADPGLIFLDRMNARNPVPGVGEYKTTAPCAEVGLVEGEACQFGYLNIGKFISRTDNGYCVDYDLLTHATQVLSRTLDNALSISIDRYIAMQSVYVMEQKRKVGIGICGVADALSLAGLPYDSDESRKLMVDILAYINYVSKLTSIQLARERGSAMSMTPIDGLDTGNRYLHNPGYLANLYGNGADTTNVTSHDWIELDDEIRRTRHLRNTTTIALPPTGRSGVVFDASTGIEPHFRLPSANESVRLRVAKDLSRVMGMHIGKDGLGNLARSTRVDTVLSEATTISPQGHLQMAASLQKLTDESISKTVNMPKGSTSSDVAEIYTRAHEMGVSGITVYVDGSHSQQPIDLNAQK